jgi:hypothetical protein
VEAASREALGTARCDGSSGSGEGRRGEKNEGELYSWDCGSTLAL